MLGALVVLVGRGLPQANGHGNLNAHIIAGSIPTGAPFNDFPHAESTWPQSRAFLDRIFTGVPEADRRQITVDNAATLFRFSLP